MERKRYASVGMLVAELVLRQEWMPLREAAALYRVTDETMLEWGRDGAFATTDVGGRLWFSREDLTGALRRRPRRGL